MTEKNFEWFEEHYPELRAKYPGKVVAIVDSDIVGIGDTIQQAEKEAKERTNKKPFFGRVRKKTAMVL